MPLWNVSTSTLSLEAMQTKARMHHENRTPNILDSAVDYSRTLYLHNGADQKACGLQEQDCLMVGYDVISHTIPVPLSISVYNWVPENLILKFPRKALAIRFT